ncbi:MAG: hypothetical protein AAF204_05540 [Pseudomonadota bacterium]
MDMEKYLSQVEGWDISQTQKQELIHTLWNFFVSCAQIGLGIHPVQSLKTLEKPSNLQENMLNLEPLKSQLTPAKSLTQKEEP